MKIKPIWIEDGIVKIIAQTLLPGEYKVLEVGTIEEMWQAIKVLEVRGAPAIGIASAFGIYLDVKESPFKDRQGFIEAVDRAAKYICTSRPTAYNLFWAADRMRRVARSIDFVSKSLAIEALREEALRILEEDATTCRSIGLYGADLIRGCTGVLTHCNAGALATAEYGTALAPIYILHEQGHSLRVYADETRPLLQGSRLTAWELDRAGIDVTVICDSMAGVVMQSGKVDAVIVGADRIAANGDSANKIGTYSLSVLAKHHGIPFYIAAPYSTVDFSLKSGDEIPIEERGDDEVRHFGHRLTAPENVKVFNPAFDVAPHENITAIITEKGIIRPPFRENLVKMESQGKIRY
jgi:methylthioribose-1-phosphate isomerase